MATHSSILAYRIPRTEEPSGLQSIGLHRVEHDLAAATYVCMQDSEIIEVIPCICISVIWGQHLHFYRNVLLLLNFLRSHWRAIITDNYDTPRGNHVGPLGQSRGPLGEITWAPRLWKIVWHFRININIFLSYNLAIS